MKDSFVRQFCSITSLSKKKEVLKQYVQKKPDLSVKEVLKNIPVLSDQYRFITMLHTEQLKNLLLKKISYPKFLALIKREIDKRADKVYRRIITKERKGKRFDEIVLEKLGPLIRKNDTIVLEEVTALLKKMPDKLLLKKAYSTFIRDLGIITGILKKVKDDGITRESVETHIFEQRDHLMKAGIRPLLKRFFYVDPAFEPVTETIAALISKLDRQSKDEEIISGASATIKKLFAELKEVDDLDEFRKHAGLLSGANQTYIREINKLYHRLLFRPLLYCYSAFRFPLDREIFRKWIEKLPLETAFSEDVMSEFFRISAEFERRYRERKPPENNEELIQLMYDSTISYTDKFKLLFSCIHHFPKTVPIRECLQKIKDVQYKCEYSFVKDMVTRLSGFYSPDNVDTYLSGKALKIKNAMNRFKKGFTKLARQLQEKHFTGRRIVFDGIIKTVKEEKKAEISLLLALDTEERKNIGFIIKLANFLIEYYFALDFFKILIKLQVFFSSYFTLGGLYLTPAFSGFSKENIHRFLSDHRKDVKLLLEKLSEYRERGTFEGKVRTALLCELGAGPGPPEIKKKERCFTIRKNHHMYSVSITDTSGLVLFSALYKGCAFFHQFLHECMNEDILKIMPIKQNELKVLYQNVHISYIKELLAYISERLDLLKKTESVSNLTQDKIKKEYIESAESDEWIEDFLSDAYQEKTFIHSLLCNIIKEEKDNVWQDENVTKRIAGEKDEYLSLLHRTDSVISYVKGLKKICYGESIQAGLKGRSPDEQPGFIMSELSRIDNKEDMLGTAAYFLVTTSIDDVVSETKDLIESQGIDRYRILLALYNVIDAHDDYHVKIRIIDEYTEYLRKCHPEVYLSIKYLLDIQKENLKNQSIDKNQKVSDIWKSLARIESRQEKIAFLDDMLNDNKSGLLSYYVEHIRAGFIAESLHEIIKQNSDLPPRDQYDLLCRFNVICGKSSLSPAERRELFKKELELETICDLYTKSGEKIFTPRDFDSISKEPYNEGISLKNMKTSLAVASRKVVEKAFTGTGISKQETQKYLNTHYKEHMPANKADIAITSLQDALDYFGDADDPDELTIVSDIIDSVSQNQVPAALELFQKKVVVESAAKREVDRLARLLFSLKQSDIILKCPELNKAIEKQLSGMKNFFIHKAKVESGMLDDDFYESDSNENTTDETGPFDYSSQPENKQTTGFSNTQASGTTFPYLSVTKVKKSRKQDRGDYTEEKDKEYQEKGKSPLLEKSIQTRVGDLIKDKGHLYAGKLIEYVRKTYKPVINEYIKNIYKKKSDFYILLGEKKQYYTYKVLKSAIKRILKEDKYMQMHPKLILSIEDDPKLFYILLYELFEEKKVDGLDSYIYLPKCLD